MSRIVKVGNKTLIGMTVAGNSIAAGTYYLLSAGDVAAWPGDSDVFALIGSGDLVVCSGTDITDDITDPVKGWNWLLGDTLPLSSSLGNKLSVHSSSKPEPDDVTTFAVWAGCGDDITQEIATNSIGAGDLLMFNMTYDAVGSHVDSKDIKFDPRHGRVWVHEAYLKFENGGIPDYLSADVMAPATTTQSVANLDCVLVDNWIKPAPGGVGTGTIGFAATPKLMPRPYSKDGDWDFDGTNLIPNLNATGSYRISDIDRPVHRYFNKIPLYGSSTTYFTLTSEETAELRVDLGYYIRINVYNNSNSAWNLSVIMEIYRERTVDP